MIDSHLNVLQKIVSVKPIPTVLEFGPGMHSTPFFFEHCDELTCVEMQNESWYRKMWEWLFEEHKKYPEKIWKIHECIGPWEYQGLSFNPWYSLIMVDGHGDSRWHVINNMFTRTDTMVVHDTQEPSYQWKKVSLPAGWVWKDFTESATWTTIVTSDMELLEKIENQ